MPRAERTEVHIVRFFEEESLEKAETVFQIVADKMRQRRNVTPATGSTLRPKRRAPERREPAESEAGEEVPAK